MKGSRAARVISFLPLAGAIGFALPILSLPDRSDLLIQDVDERRQIVKGFRPIEAQPDALTPLSSSVLVGVGDPQVYVFVARGGEAMCGPLERLENKLRLCAEEFAKEEDIQLQIYELIGTENEKRVARASIQEKVANDLGAGAARFFANASLRSELWDLLLEAAPDDFAATRVLSVRSRLDATITRSGGISLDIECVRKESWVDEDELLRCLLQRFDFLIREVDGASSGAPPRDDGDFLFHGIEAARQEERVALLLRALHTDPETAWYVASSYSPRTQFEQKSMQIIRRHFEPNVFPSMDPSKLAQYCAFRIFREVYPRNRGRYLLYLARHMGDETEVAAFVKQKASTSNAVDVEAFRDEIFEALDARS